MTKQLTAKDLAALLHGRQYTKEITAEEEAAAKAAGLVVVFGCSDDNVELRGAIDDEIPAWDGTNFNLAAYEHGFHPIEAVWCGPDTEAAWTFRTEIPHEKFNIYEDEDLFCVGIVFSLEDLE